jgi:hypothetical protein
MSLLTTIRRELDAQIHSTIKLAKFNFWCWMFRQTEGYVPHDFSGKQWTLTKHLLVIAALYAGRLSSGRKGLRLVNDLVSEFLFGYSPTTKTEQSSQQNTPEDSKSMGASSSKAKIVDRLLRW